MIRHADETRTYTHQRGHDLPLRRPLRRQDSNLDHRTQNRRRTVAGGLYRLQPAPLPMAWSVLTDSGVQVIADSGYRGTGFAVPQRRRPADPETGRRRLSRNQRGQLRSRPPTRPRRARQRLARELEGPPQDPLLPAAGDQPRQGRPSPHPRWLTPSGKDSVSVISSGFG